MEGRKQVDSKLSSSSFPSSSSSSLVDDIFGPKQTPSDNVFGSIFPPPSQPKVAEREFANPRPNEIKHDFKFEQHQNIQPCHLSSSIYYGGQAVYSPIPHDQDAKKKSAGVEKDGGEDDTGSASRGNWWQGSLYY